MGAAQQTHDRFQKFIQSARRGRFDRKFGSADCHAWDLAQTLIDSAEFLPVELLAGACTFAKLCHDQPMSARAVVGLCTERMPLTPRAIQTSRSKKFPRPPK